MQYKAEVYFYSFDMYIEFTIPIMTQLYCSVLDCIEMYCIVLYCIVLYCIGAYQEHYHYQRSNGQVGKVDDDAH